MSIKVCCISDLHGRLPRLLPDHDLLLIGGDICPLENHHELYQKMWLSEVFRDWWEELDSPAGFGCWGNHDMVAEKKNEGNRLFRSSGGRELFISDYGKILDYKGLDIYLFAHQLAFGNGWAFNRDEAGLDDMFSKIPKADIIVSHGPAYGYGDTAPRRKPPGFELTGSKSLLAAIDRLQPKLVVCGHIHPGYGVYHRNNTTIVNASILNDQYKIANDPVVIDI